LDKYVITEDGKLLLDGERVNFHGMLEFHHFDSKSNTYWSYEAKFTDGELVEIKPKNIYTHAGIYPTIKYIHHFPVDGDCDAPNR
jgi:hypothetical protein